MAINNTLKILSYKFKKDDKLWSFQATNSLEVYAETLSDAMEDVRLVEAETGIEFKLTNVVS